MIISVFVLGMILLVINVIMISLIRVSYTTDVRIKVRQGLEFAGEVMQRNVKSADPEGIEVIDWPPAPATPINKALRFRITEGSMDSDVVFCVESDPDDEEIGVLMAKWTEDGVERIVYLTSPDEIDVDAEKFEISVTEYEESGIAEVLIDIYASSSLLEGADDPVVDTIFKQIRIIVRYNEI